MKIRVIAPALILVVTLLVPSWALVAQSLKTVPAVEDLMSAKEFEAAGLRKLTPTELAALNLWLQKYTVGLAQAQMPEALPQLKALPTPELIETRIDGEFAGWEGETIFKLMNGQIWQQASYAYTYHYAYGPKVLIYRSGGSYKMKVDGVNSEIIVRRLK